MPRGEGWWIASDGKWYPPHLHPDVLGKQAEGHTPAGSGEEAGDGEAGDGEAGDARTRPRGGSPWPGWEEVAADQGLPRSARSESLAYPQGWWLASDGNWYPPELHPSGNGRRAGSTAVSPLGGELPGATGAAATSPEAAEAPGTEAEGAEAEEAEASAEGATQAAPGATEPLSPSVQSSAKAATAAAAAAVHAGRASGSAERDADTWSLAIEAVTPAGVTGRERRRRNNLVALSVVLALVVGGSIAGGIVGLSSGSHPRLTAAERASRDRRNASRIALRLVDMPAGWLPAVPLPSRAPASPDPFTAAGRSALAAADPSCSPVGAAFADATKGADAVTTTDYQTPLGGATPAYGALESQVAFFPTDRLAKDDVARLSDSRAACIGAAVKVLLVRALIVGTKVVVQTASSRPAGLTASQSGFQFTATGTVSNGGASYPLRFVVEGTTGSRGVVLVYSGSVAGGGGNAELVQSLFGRLAERVRRFDP